VAGASVAAEERAAQQGAPADFSAAPPAGELTLADAVAAALAEGHASQIAQLEVERSRDAAGQERSAYLPRASITSNAGYNNRWNEKLQAVDSSGVQRTYGLSSLASDEGWFNVYLDQLLLDLATWQRIARAELETEAAALAREQERESVAFEVLQRFLEALRQEQLVGLARRRAELAETLDQQAGLLLAAGRTRPADRERVALLLEEARVDAASRAADVRNARALLALAMGREGTAAPERLDATSLPDVQAAPEAEADVTASPELRVLDLRRKAEEKGIAVARAGHLPTVAVRGGYSHYGIKRYDNYPDAVRVGVNLDVPLFQGFKNEYAIEGAAKSAEIARIRYRQLLETKRARVRELAQRLASGSGTPALAERRVAASQERLRLAELSLRAERGGLDEVLAVLGDSARDERAAIDAQLDRVILWGQLRRETGTLAQALGGARPAPPASAQSQD
jgi:outer membrane protein TolC